MNAFGDPFIIGPGERVMLGYEFELTINPTAFTAAESVGATYSDPLRLSGNPRFTLQFQPVSAAAPEPSSLALLGALLLMGCRWRGRPRDGARKQT